MSSPAECVACARFGDRECDRCGDPVCPMHYDGEMGFCGDCAARAKPDGRRGDTFQL